MVPKSWEVRKLEELCPNEAPITYGVLKPGEFFPGGIPLLQIKDLRDGYVLTNDLHLISPELDKEYKRSRIVKNDILISLVGTIGRIAKYRSDSEANIHRNIGRIRTKSHEYLYHFLNSSLAQNEIGGSSSGSSQSALNLSTLRSMKVPLPPLPEQKKIAQILSTWDQAITATERLLENSQQRKKGLMQQLLTGKKRLPGFEGEWREEELGKLVTISKGEQLNRSTLSEAGLYPVINGGITPSGYTDKTNCHGNTVTISEGGNSCGFVAFQQVPFWCGGHCYALKSPQVPVMFLYQLLKLYEVKIMRMRVGSGLPNIQKKDLSSLKLCLPSCPDEQEAIGQILGLADKECRLLVDRLNSLKQEKIALMQQLLTGKRRVQVDTEAA